MIFPARNLHLYPQYHLEWIFHSYVKLPEGNHWIFMGFPVDSSTTWGCNDCDVQSWEDQCWCISMASPSNDWDGKC